MIPIFTPNTPEVSRYLDKIKSRSIGEDVEVRSQVIEIIHEVQKRGDQALVEYSRRFDGIELRELRISSREIQSMAEAIDPELLEVIRQAAENIRSYHLHQVEKSWEYEAADGVRLGQRISPLRSVGLYVPGGTAAYPSTVLMNAIPAQIAGVERIAVTTPCH